MIFKGLCQKNKISFTPSRIGSYWLNDYNEDTEIDVMAIDNQKKQIFVGECKYHKKPIDASVYFGLKEKIDHNKDIHKAYPNYDVIYGIFSKSGFTQRMLDTSKENKSILLVNEDSLM